MPNEVLERYRQKYPAYKNVPDQELAGALVKKHPVYAPMLRDVIGVQQGPVGKFFGELGSGLNPITGIAGMIHALEHPINTLTADVAARRQLGQESNAAGVRGYIVTAFAKRLYR